MSKKGNSHFTCQNCGCKQFTRVKPEAGYAFAKDFQCRQCKWNVPAFVPKWGAYLMLLLGGSLALLGGFWTFVNATGGHFTGAIIGAAMLLFGGRFAIAGFQSLIG